MTTAVIIGHGPSPRGNGWGRHIDDADLVVRMFNCAWQDAADYGTKYDAGLVTADQRSLSWLHMAPVRRPASWWMYSPSGSIYRMVTELPQELVTLAAEQQVARSLTSEALDHPFAFTRGAAAVLHSITKGLRTVILAGLDEVVSGRFSEVAYPQACHEDMAKNADLNVCAPRPAGSTKSDCHDLGIEFTVIRHVAKQNGVSIVTAQEAWG